MRECLSSASAPTATTRQSTQVVISADQLPQSMPCQQWQLHCLQHNKNLNLRRGLLMLAVVQCPQQTNMLGKMLAQLARSDCMSRSILLANHCHKQAQDGSKEHGGIHLGCLHGLLASTASTPRTGTCPYVVPNTEVIPLPDFSRVTKLP